MFFFFLRVTDHRGIPRRMFYFWVHHPPFYKSTPTKETSLLKVTITSSPFATQNTLSFQTCRLLRSIENSWVLFWLPSFRAFSHIFTRVSRMLRSRVLRSLCWKISSPWRLSLCKHLNEAGPEESDYPRNICLIYFWLVRSYYTCVVATKQKPIWWFEAPRALKY